MNLFFAPDLSPEDTHYVFDKDESRHISKVLRKRVGDTLFLTDGKGGWFEAKIVEAHPKHTGVQIKSYKQKKKPPYKLHVAIAPTKSNDRFEWFLEKAVEIGVDTITPLLTAHSERKKINTGRYEKIIIAAMKQSLQTYKPLLNDLTRWDDFLQKTDKNSQKLMAFCQAEKHLKEVLEPRKDTLLLIGPEGGFAPNESEQAVAQGFKPVKLSPNRLRTETAGLVAVTAFHLQQPEN